MVERDENGRITKGVLNPGGRKALDPELKEAFRADTFDYRKVLRSIVLGVWDGTLGNMPMWFVQTKSSDALKAIDIAYDRAWGKPEQAIELDGAIRTSNIDASKLPKDQKDAIIALAAQSFTAADDASTD